MGHIAVGDTPVAKLTDVWLLDWFKTKSPRSHQGTFRVWTAIMRAFDAIGTPMTVRQMFYALVSGGAIAKTEQGYDQVGYHLLHMRRCGVIPYRFIADNTRWMRKQRSYASLADFLEASQELYRRAIWEEQAVRVEVWIEKDALAGVVYDVTEPWDVPLMVTRGFPSETFVYEAVEAIKEDNKPTHVYYFGDYDPSGVAIAIGLEAKMREWTSLVTFEHMAVRREQIITMGLQTRPTKKTDSRAKSWEDASVELDAIPANVLRQMVGDCIERHISEDQLHAIQMTEQAERETLQQIAEQWGHEAVEDDETEDDDAADDEEEGWLDAGFDKDFPYGR
jgi:hypothetical protein